MWASCSEPFSLCLLGHLPYTGPLITYVVSWGPLRTGRQCPASPHLLSCASPGLSFPPGPGSEKAVRKQGSEGRWWNLDSLYLKRNPMPHWPQHSPLGEASRWPGHKEEGFWPSCPSSPPLLPPNFPTFTPNTHLPSGVTAHISEVDILSWAHLSRCHPPSALFRGPRGGRKPSDSPLSTAKLCSCLTHHVSHDLTSLSFHFPFFCQLVIIIRPSSWGWGEGGPGGPTLPAYPEVFSGWM